jgi:hypothetical protein
MTIHRLMSVIASEQVQLQHDDRSIDTPAPGAATDDRSDVAAD